MVPSSSSRTGAHQAPKAFPIRAGHSRQTRPPEGALAPALTILAGVFIPPWPSQRRESRLSARPHLPDAQRRAAARPGAAARGCLGNHVERRYCEDSQEGRKDHSPEHWRADPAPREFRCAICHDQGIKAENEGERGHYDRPEPQARSLDAGFALAMRGIAASYC
jgi:hypothetical protein